MDVSVKIPFETLADIVRQLSALDKARLQLVLQEDSISPQEESLTDLLLNGPVFTEEQIETIRETRKEINQWRSKPL